MNIRLLIAEDEKLERQALRTFITREFPDTEIMDDALNGVDLVRKATEYNPDIIITDIKMPGLNGLSAVSRLQENGYTGKIIVQTAYSEFGYAREALELDAEAYLLKPIKQERVKEVISKTIERIQNEKSREDLRQQQLKILQKAVPLLDAEIVSSVQLNEIQSNFLRSYLLQRKIQLSVLCIITLQTAEAEQSLRNIENHELLVDAAKKIREKEGPDCRIIIGRPSNNKITMIIGTQLDNEYKIKLQTIEVAEKILAAISSGDVISNGFRIGIGQPVKALYNLNQAYKESLTALRLCTSDSTIQHYGDLNPENDFNPPLITGETDLLNCILDADCTAVEKQTDQYLGNPILDQLKLNALKDTLLDSLIDLFKQISALLSRQPHSMETFSALLRSLSEFKTRSEVKTWFRKEVIKLSQNYSTQTRERIHRCVLKAKEYIEKNYMKNISLDIVAEEIGVSPYHLSHLFKQELNQNYIKYLTDFRIKKAEELLSKGDYSLTELSRLSGYNNPSYFSKVFRKNTGKIIREVNGFCRIIHTTTVD